MNWLFGNNKFVYLLAFEIVVSKIRGLETLDSISYMSYMTYIVVSFNFLRLTFYLSVLARQLLPFIGRIESCVIDTNYYTYNDKWILIKTTCIAFNSVKM